MTSVFAVVKWVKDNNLFSTVKLSTISLPPKTSQPVLDQIYPVYFDKAFHDGQIKFIGEHGECKLKEKIILGQNSTASPKPNPKYKSLVFTQPIQKSTPSSPMPIVKTKSVASTQQSSPKPSIISAKPKSASKIKPVASTQLFSPKNSSINSKPINSAIKSKPIYDDDSDYIDSNVEDDDESDEVSEEEFLDSTVVTRKPKPAVKAKVVADMLFERSKSDIDLEVMKNKYQELNLDRNLQFEQIKALKEKNAHLEEQNKLHINKLSPEDIARQLLIAKFTFKAFGTAEDLIEISEFTKADSILKGQVILCGEYPRVLIGTLKRAMLLESLKKKTKGAQVFTEAMNMFYPLDTDWADRNAEAFIQECPDTIKSILGFILQNKTDDISSFVWPEVRALLTTKCGDRRSKIKSALEKDKKDTEKARMLSLNFTVDEEEVTKCSGDQEFEILNERNAHDDDEAEEAIGLASKVKTYEDEQDDNDHYHLSDDSITEIDEDDQFSKRSAASNDIQINKTISQKHKLISIGCLSSLTKSKKNKKQ